MLQFSEQAIGGNFITLQNGNQRLRCHSVRPHRLFFARFFRLSERNAGGDKFILLQQQFPELPVETVEKAVLGQYEQFEGRPVRDFVPILVERAAQDQLRTGDAARG